MCVIGMDGGEGREMLLVGVREPMVSGGVYEE